MNRFLDSMVSYSAHAAYAQLLSKYDEESKEFPFKGFIDITEQVNQGMNPDRFSGLNLGCLFCYTRQTIGENVNKIQFSIEDNIFKGTRDWETKYVLIADYPKSGKAIDGVLYDYKKDAEDKAKLWVTANKRDAHIKLVKTLNNSDPIVGSIFYKPSPHQELCEYIFIN
jgi:hypothetical protein